jgi:very-short-patch-repair endonuclease
LLTAGQLRGPKYQRLLPDVYASSELTPDLALRSRAAHVWLAGEGVLAGYSAAEIYCAQCAPADAPTEVIIPGRARRAAGGIVVRRDLLADDEHRTYDGVRLTTPVRTAYDLARRAPSLVEAVVAVDSLAGRFGFPTTDILALARRYPRARGRRRLAEVVAHAQPLAESAMETRLRMLLVLAGLPLPKVQHTIVDERGRILATVDLAYRRQRVAIEYEGAEHFTPLRTIRDARRYTRIVALGWRVYRYVSTDVYGSPDRIVDEITRALRTRKSA